MPNKERQEDKDMEKTETYTSEAPALYFQPIPQIMGTSTVAIRPVEKPKLILEHKGGRYRISTTKYAEFGRDYFTDLGPKAQYISHKHFALKYENGQLYIADLGSKNGTYVNGQDIRGKGWVELKPGDTVAVVDIEFQVVENK